MPASFDRRPRERRSDRVLRDGGQAYVAIETSSGPHVTPELHLWWQERLWLVVARRTLKARVLRNRPEVGALVLAGGEAVMVRGRARVIDAQSPSTLLDGAPEALLSALALTNYALRHAADLTGFVADLGSRRIGLGALSPRVLLAVRPEATAVVADGEVVDARGVWAPRGTGAGRDDDGNAERRRGHPLRAGDLDALPEDTAALVDTRRRCVVGWMSGRGPLALPGWWLPSRSAAVVPAGVFDLASLPANGPASITLDADERPGPAGKHGLVVRGSAVATIEDGWATIGVDPDRVTWWEGVRTETQER